MAFSIDQKIAMLETAASNIEDHDFWSCSELHELVRRHNSDETHDLVEEYKAMFRPDGPFPDVAAWATGVNRETGIEGWNVVDGVEESVYHSQQLQDCRVLALCLAAAVIEWGGLDDPRDAEEAR